MKRSTNRFMLLWGSLYIRPRWWRNKKTMSFLVHHTQLLMFCLLSTGNALTITTFNILAPVHRSMNALNHRESEREDWWRPRAEGVAEYISKKFNSSDVILLQECKLHTYYSHISVILHHINIYLTYIYAYRVV